MSQRHNSQPASRHPCKPMMLCSAGSMVVARGRPLGSSALFRTRQSGAQCTVMHIVQSSHIKPQDASENIFSMPMAQPSYPARTPKGYMHIYGLHSSYSHIVNQPLII
eukprot:scaffold19214_cov39-Prasinocladus_malaysianus.AAC.1